MASIHGNKIFSTWGRFLKAVLAFSCAGAACASPAVDTVDADACPDPLQYSVINLAPGSGAALLNKRGQVAFTGSNSFFDGHKMHMLGSLGSGYTVLRGVNDMGVVVGQSQDAQSRYRAFTWTVKDGMRSLPGAFTADAYAVNNLSQVVGYMQDVPLQAHARRWNPDGTLTKLGPETARIATARAINSRGEAVGDGEVTRYNNHAIFWDADGKETVLGNFGGTYSGAHHINEAGQLLGYYYLEQRKIHFIWSRAHGMVRIGDTDTIEQMAGLNNHGDVIGNAPINIGLPQPGRPPYVWSQRRGLRSLPLAGAHDGIALALNNRRQVVGQATSTQDGVSSQRAVVWNDISSPVDLNTRLYRAPAGLVLYSARAINDDGVIVAESNAGLVLLRPGRSGTTAPVLGPITGGPKDAAKLGERVDLMVAFVDSNAGESHRASAQIDDGCPQNAPSLREQRGSGDVSVRHTFCRAGNFTLTVKVTDRAGNVTQVQRGLSVLDAVSGG